MVSVSLERSGESIYLGRVVGRAGSAGVRLDDHFALRFDLELRERVVGLYVEEECDPLQIAAVLGFDAARNIASGSESITLSEELPPAGRLVARAALLSRLLEVPILLDARSSWTAQLALIASELVEYGLDTRDLLTDSLHRLPPLLGPADAATRRTFHADEEIVEAVHLGAATLDPMDDEWLWFDALSPDLGQKTLDLMSLLEATPRWEPMAEQQAEEASPRWEPMADQQSELDARELVFRGGGPRKTTKTVESWELPLYWPQLDEAMRPEDDGFDKAVLLTRDPTLPQSNIAVRIEAPTRDRKRPALYTRVIAGGEIFSTSALLANDEGWQGTVTLPGDFDRRFHHLEVISSGKMMKPPLADHEKQECEQWALLAIGLEDRGRDSSYARERADQLISPPRI